LSSAAYFTLDQAFTTEAKFSESPQERFTRRLGLPISRGPHERILEGPTGIFKKKLEQVIGGDHDDHDDKHRDQQRG
jgi:hypothetical protein